MDVTVAETATIPGTDYVKNIFSTLPTDYRYSKITTQQVLPVTPLQPTSKTVDFILSKLDAPYVYLLSNTLICANVVITKENLLTVPDTGKTVGPINNALSSLFSSCFMSVNDTVITRKLNISKWSLKF
jgi:hypothetical protein